MNNNKNQIRNSDGSFICEVFYEDDIWVVAIKKKTVYTYILLYDNGSIRIINEDDGEPIKDVHHMTSTIE